MSEDPASDDTMTMTWEVTPVDARTRVDIRADDVPDGINAATRGGSVVLAASWDRTSTVDPRNASDFWALIAVLLALLGLLLGQKEQNVTERIVIENVMRECELTVPPQDRPRPPERPH